MTELIEGQTYVINAPPRRFDGNISRTLSQGESVVLVTETPDHDGEVYVKKVDSDGETYGFLMPEYLTPVVDVEDEATDGECVEGCEVVYADVEMLPDYSALPFGYVLGLLDYLLEKNVYVVASGAR